MRRLVILEHLLPRVRPSTLPATPFICAACVRQRASFSTTRRLAAPSNERLPYTERIRRRIWGTDSPPGQKDPYGPGSYVDEIRERNLIKQASQKKKAAPAETAIDPTYVAATTWDGLEEVGGRVYTPQWGLEYSGFIPAEPVNDPYEITAAVHRAIVETFTLQQAGWPLSMISNTTPTEDITGDVQIVPSASGQGAQIQYTETATVGAILQSLEHPPNPTESEEDVDADRSSEDPLKEGIYENPPIETEHERNPTESEEDVNADRSTNDPLHEAEKVMRSIEIQRQVASWDPIWLGISLENPEVKFIIVKRVMQLTGIRIPDVKLRSVSTVSELLDFVIQPPKPTKLAEDLAEREDLLNLPNVKVYDRRITPIDKEVSVGRWKVIEKELERRGLPVTGHLPKNEQRLFR